MKPTLLKSFLLGVSCLTSLFCFGQKSIKDSTISFIAPAVCYMAGFGAGDLGTRFGFGSQFGLECSFKTKRNKFLTVGGYYLFSDDVKETYILDNIAFTSVLKDEQGNIIRVPGWIDEQGQPFTPQFQVRAWTFPIKVGYLINKLRFRGQNPNSGVFIEAGSQFFQHRIHLQANENQVPWLKGDYLKGYDRLTNGIGVLLGIGFKLYSSARMINFALSYEVSQNFTYNRRTQDFFEGRRITARRDDVLHGVRLSWCVPLYKVAPEPFYFE